MGTTISQVAVVGWIWLILAGAAQGAITWHVDDDNCPGPGSGTPVDPFCSIQRGIDASVSGDEVLVAPGTYNETINFHGKAITLRSADGPDVTIIDATGLNDRVVECTSGEGPDTVLQGFSLTGGRAPGNPGGGGMYNLNSSPTILNCIFFGNTSAIPNAAGSSLGGGMVNNNSSPSVINCVFRNNRVMGWGGGGGMANFFSSNPQIVNSTFHANDAVVTLGAGGGIRNLTDSASTITNCIFWGNMDGGGQGETAQIYGPAVVNYSLVQGGWTGMGGAGNIDADPLFVDPDGADNLSGTQDDDLRLRAGSPAIDAGDSASITAPTDLDGNPRFGDDPNTLDTGNGAPPIVDIGAYEFRYTPIPTLSEWGLVVMTLVLLTAGTAIIRRRRPCGALPCAPDGPHAVGAVLRALRALTGIALCNSVAWAQVQVGPQIRIDVDGGTAAANETSIASSNSSPYEIVASWNDWRQSSGSEVIRVGVAVSNNGGVTWSDFLVRPPQAYQSQYEFDPMTAYDDRTGTLWVGGISGEPGAGIGVFVARKIAGQPAFEPSVMAHITSSADKGWMAAGPPPGNPNATNVYIAYNLGVLRSTNMGVTWTGPVSLGSGFGFLPRIGPNGELYVAYAENFFIPGFDKRLFLRRSFNGGQTFQPRITIVRLMDFWDPTLVDTLQIPGRFRVPQYAYLAVDPNNGTLYCVYFDTTDMVGGNSNVDLYFTKSTNQGLTWTTPVVINGDANPPGDQFFPWLEVDEESNLHMVFLDSRHTVQDDNVVHGMFDAYYSFSNDGGATWHEFRLTPASFDSDNDGLDRPGEQFLGDYLGLARSQDRFYPCYLSTQNGDPDIYTHVIRSLGGCCLANWCELLSEDTCTSVGGTFLGAWTTCTGPDCEPNGVPDVCEGAGACCLPDESCVVITAGCCAAQDGFFFANEPQCEFSPCGQINGPSQGP